MKRIVVLVLLSYGRLFAQFEGVLESNNMTIDQTGLQQRFVTSIWIKDGMAKITNTAMGSTPAVTMIYRADLKTLWMINDDDSTYFEVAQTDHGGDRPAPAGPDEKSVVRKTGKTKKVLGYLCEQYMVTHGEGKTEIWGTKSLASLGAALAAALGSEPGEGSWTDELTALGVFPLQASTRIEGNVVESQEVTKIERRSLPPEIFEIPRGYAKQSVGDMLK